MDKQTDLEAQLAEIDRLMKERQEEINVKRGLPITTPVDPAELTMCDGCQ